MRRTTLGPTGAWLDLGLKEYASAARLQQELAAAREAGEIPDTFIVVEHPPCVTIGRGASGAHILVSTEILEEHGVALHESDRGGDVTYHGPGQLVCYAIVDLGEHGQDLHAHVRRLEAVMIDVTASFGVPCWRRQGFPGVWVAAGKIGAVGVAVRRWVTRHGMAFNVDPDMAPYRFIVPCGLSDCSVTSLALVLGRSPDLPDVRERMREACGAVFHRRLQKTTIGDLMGTNLRTVSRC